MWISVRRMAEAGFSLIEMLLVVFLMTIIVSGIAVMQSAMLQDKGKILRDVVAHDQADYARRRMISILSDVTLLRYPDAPGTGGNVVSANEVEGWQDLDTIYFINCTGSSCQPNPAQSSNWKSLLGGAGAGVTWFRLCYDSPGKSLFLYRAPMHDGANIRSSLYADASVPATDACGNATAHSITFTEGAQLPTPSYERLAGGMANSRVETLVSGGIVDTTSGWGSVFHRKRKNILEFAFSVQVPDGTDPSKVIHNEVMSGASIAGTSQ
jgi:hypothetical protein